MKLLILFTFLSLFFSCGLKENQKEMERASNRLTEAINALEKANTSVSSAEGTIEDNSEVLYQLENVLSTLEGYFKVFAQDCVTIVFQREILSPSMEQEDKIKVQESIQFFKKNKIKIADLDILTSARNPELQLYIVPKEWMQDPNMNSDLINMTEFVIKPGSACEQLLETLEVNFLRVQEDVMEIVEGLMDDFTGDKAGNVPLDCDKYRRELKAKEEEFYRQLNKGLFNKVRNWFKSKEEKTFKFDKNHPCHLADFKAYTDEEITNLNQKLEDDWVFYLTQWKDFYSKFKANQLDINYLASEYQFPEFFDVKAKEYKEINFEEFVRVAADLLKPIARSKVGFHPDIDDETFKKRLNQHVGPHMTIGERDPYVFSFDKLALDKEIKVCREIFDVLWAAKGEGEQKMAKEFLINSIFFIYERQVIGQKIELSITKNSQNISVSQKKR